MHKSGERESDQSRAKQHNTRNGHSQETVRSELLTHGAPPSRVRPAQSERLACCTVKGIVIRRAIWIEVDVSVQHQTSSRLIFPAAVTWFDTVAATLVGLGHIFAIPEFRRLGR